jgi:hypothetical protein
MNLKTDVLIVFRIPVIILNTNMVIIISKTRRIGLYSG